MPEIARSLEEIIVDDIHEANWDDFLKTGQAKNLNDKTVVQAFKKIYAHIEQQAMAVYKSNEPWALKQWAYEHILTDERAKSLPYTMILFLTS